MRAGTLRHRITIQQPSASQDTYGEEIITWSTWATVWAAVEPMRADERYTANDAQLLAEADTRIRIRYRPGVTHQMRVSFESRLFDIQGVINLETRDREIHLLCKEKPDG